MHILWQRARFLPCKPLGPDGNRITGSKEHIDLARSAAEESMVLLKNNGVLPLQKGQKIAVFGKGQLDYVQGGTGSGMVICAYHTSLLNALARKEADGMITLYQPLREFYEANYHDQLLKAVSASAGDVSFSTEVQIKDLDLLVGNMMEPDCPESLLDSASEFTDTAIVAISRSSGENHDRSLSDYYLSQQENDLLQAVQKRFPYVIVTLNVGSQMEAKWLRSDKISAALYMGTAGMEGGSAAADILCGQVCPCGKLSNTWAEDYWDYPTCGTFRESPFYVDYEEDIFVGYRYFETIPGVARKVVFPFGHGLSYTCFAQKIRWAGEKDGIITVSVDVTNTGLVAGKEVVQVYYGAPQGKLGKASRSLAAFAKTKLLAPGETQTLDISFELYRMASYDDTGIWKKSAYILERGEYPVWCGNSVRNADLCYTYRVDEAYCVVQQLSERCPVLDLSRKLRADGTFEAVPHRRIPPQDYPNPPAVKRISMETYTLHDVAEGKITLDTFVAQFDKSETAALLGGIPNTGVACTRGFGGLPEWKIPALMTADSPSGMRVHVESGVMATCFPSESCIACSWDEKLIEEVTSAIALEIKENNIYAWLAPALNIQRDPLCGRNFEYYSEDPIVSGKLAAAAVRGAQKHRISACPKHFACNNKEEGRKESDSHVTERAMREIYLKGFEICVKESNPKTIMTSYNMLNGRYTSENADLITHILRGEWGFDGVVMTDWNNYCRHGEEARCGNDLKMSGGDPRMLKYYYGRALPKGQAQACVRNMLKLILWYEGIEV